MSCNAWNHAPDCECGWGGQYHGSAAQDEIRYRSFSDNSSYVNPNANCPVCGKVVFFYQSPHGGRVFFDDLGWPWPKHPCTDNSRSQKDHVRFIARQSERPFKNSDGHTLDVYRLQGIINHAERLFEIILKNTIGLSVLRIILIRDGQISDDEFLDEIRSAPSFVIRTRDVGPGSPESGSVEFISASQKRVTQMRFQKAHISYP